MGGAFSNANYLQKIGEERHDGQKDQEVVEDTKLKGSDWDIKGANRHLILQAKIIGSWMSVRSTTVSVTVFSATEFWYFLCARYNVPPPNLQSHYDRCGTAFGETHVLSCSTGGQVIARHIEICDELLYLSQRAFTPASVHSKPLIRQGSTRSE